MAKGAGKPILYLVGQPVDIVNLHLTDSAHTLADETGRRWLDLAFDDEPLFYDWSRTERINVDHLKRFLQNYYQIVSCKTNGSAEIWYQLEVDSQTKLFQPKRDTTSWQTPDSVVDVIYISRSANLSSSDIDDIKIYLDKHPQIKLVVDQPVNRQLIDLSDWLLLRASGRAQALKQISLAPGAKRIFIQGYNGRWWLSDTQQTLEGEIGANFPDEEWLRTVLAVALGNWAVEDAAGLILAGIRQIERGEALDLTKIDMDFLDFANLKVVQGRPNFRRHLRRLRRTWLDTKPNTLWHLDSLSEISPKFKSKNYNQLVELIITQPHFSDRVGAILLDPQIVSAFGQIKLPTDVLLGIRVDAGSEKLPGFASEIVTTGLDGLDRRLEMYRHRGFDLASWRVWYDLGEELKDMTILSNSHLAARFARLSQDSGLLPIIEFKVTGDDWSRLNRAIKSLSAELKLFKVDLEQVGLLVNSSVALPDDVKITSEASQFIKLLEQPHDDQTVSVKRTDLGDLLELSNSLPSSEIEPEIRLELEKLFIN